MDSVFELNLLLLMLYLAISCSSGSREQGNSAQPDRPHYNISTSSCSTGPHNFTGSEGQAQDAYCAALLDEELNNACAQEERYALYEQNCANYSRHSSEDGSLVPRSDTSKVSPAKSLKISYGPSKDDEKVSALGRPNLNYLSNNLQLWAVQYDDFSFRLNDLASQPPNLEEFIQDFMDCSFSYAGPNCFEGQEKSIKTQEMLKIGDKEYLFTVFNYSVSYDQLYALFLETTQASASNNTISSEHANAYLYSIQGSDQSLNPEEILSERAATCLAHIKYNVLSAAKIDEILTKTTSLRQKLSLLQTKVNMPQFGKSVILAPSLRRELQSSLGAWEAELREIEEANSVVLWLSLHQWILSENEYLDFLKAEEQGRSKVFAMEAALLEVSLGQNSESIEDYYAQALNVENLSTQYRAFRLARARIGLSEKILLSLVSTLNHPNYNSALIAFNILSEAELTDVYVEKLARLTTKFGNNGSAYVFAFDLLKKINTGLSHNAVIAQLSHKNPDIRNKVYQTVDELDFTEASIAAAAVHMNSKEEKSCLYAASILDEINTPPATLVLIQFMDRDVFYLRDNIIGLLNNEQKVFTDLHLGALVGHLDPRFPDKVLDPAIKYLFRLGSPGAIKALLQFVNKRKNLYIADDVRRTWMLEDFDHASFNEEHAQELGIGFSGKMTDVRDKFLYYLIHLRHFESTAVLLEKLTTDPEAMLPNFTKVKDELEDRFAQDHELFGGECGLMLGNLFMKSRFELGKLELSSTLDEAGHQTVEYYQNSNRIAMEYLLSLRTGSALKSLVKFMGIKEDDLRQEIIAAIGEFKVMPREVKDGFLAYVRPKPDECIESSGSCPETHGYELEFEPAPSSFPEVREMAYKSLFWIFHNTKNERTPYEIRNNIDEILWSLYCNIAYYLLTDLTRSKEMIPILYDESIRFLNKIIDDEQEDFYSQFTVNYFLAAVVPMKETNCNFRGYPETLAWRLGVFELMKRVPHPKVVSWFDDFYSACPSFYEEVPELGRPMFDFLAEIEPVYFIKEYAQQAELDGQTQLVEAYLDKLLPKQPNPLGRCEFFARSVYFDSRRIAGIKALGEISHPSIMPWFAELIQECSDLSTSNQELFGALSSLVGASSAKFQH